MESSDHSRPHPVHAAQLQGKVTTANPNTDLRLNDRPTDVTRYLPSLPVHQGAVSSSLTCLQLHKRAERVAALLMERGGLQDGDHVALVYPPGQRSTLRSLRSSGAPPLTCVCVWFIHRYRPDRCLLRLPVRRLCSHHSATAAPSEHFHHAAHR